MAEDKLKIGHMAPDFVLRDQAGKIVFFKVYEIGQLPDIKEILSFLKQLVL